MEWLFFLVAIGISAYLYYFQRPFFDKHKGFIEFALILFTALFAIYQVKSSADDFNQIVERMNGIVTSAEESKKSLKEVEKSLAELPRQIDTFSTSIRSLNDVVSQQRDKLEKTLEDFSGSIKGFQESVDNMAKRFDRHPKLTIDVKKIEDDSIVTITSIVLTNTGTSIAEIFALRIQVEESALISFEFEGARETDKQGTFLSYQQDYLNNYVVPNQMKPTVSNCKILIRKGKSSRLGIYAYYTSPFGNAGDVDRIYWFRE